MEIYFVAITHALIQSASELHDFNWSICGHWLQTMLGTSNNNIHVVHFDVFLT